MTVIAAEIVRRKALSRLLAGLIRTFVAYVEAGDASASCQKICPLFDLWTYVAPQCWHRCRRWRACRSPPHWGCCWCWNVNLIVLRFNNGTTGCAQCELMSLPPLACMSRLTALGLRCNALAGLPPVLADAKRVQILDLSFNMPLMRAFTDADASLLLSLPALRVRQ